MIEVKNIFKNIPPNLPKEISESLVESKTFKVERIVSKGHKSPNDFWYDQDMNEWVLILQGRAKLLFAEEKELIRLEAGDYINIPAHKKHRVEWTNPDTETIWLAIFY
jgi:cupin 2 domain-containing protein